MKILVINGTEVKGCTYNIKEKFLEELKPYNEIKEIYLPKDMPYFCCGCKTCFLKSEALCPHAEFSMPIWNEILDADLLVFSYPIYALRTTAQTKALLDHLCVHWMVHRPNSKMFKKRAVILTNAVGMFINDGVKDVATSLSWLGISDIKSLKISLIEGVIWNQLSEKKKTEIIKQTKQLAVKYKNYFPANMSVKTSLKFKICKIMHNSAAKNENTLSADNAYWLAQGWIKLHK